MAFLWFVACHGLFALLLGIIGSLRSVIVTLPGHVLYYSLLTLVHKILVNVLNN